MPFLIAFMLIGAIALAFLRTPRGRGWLGELRVKLVIGKTKPDVRYVINDLRIRVNEEKTVQIDHVLINPNGIFVIETKNYSGIIYGTESQHEWTQVLKYGRVKNKLYNPTKQNKSHVYHITNLIGGSFPVISAVVFVQGNTKCIRASNVYNLRGLKRLIGKKEYHLSLDQMKSVYTRLTEVNDSSIKNSEHIKNIRKLKSRTAKNICPRCGKKLVLRKGKNGSFMGCEGFPACRFTKNV